MLIKQNNLNDPKSRFITYHEKANRGGALQNTRYFKTILNYKYFEKIKLIMWIR